MISNKKLLSIFIPAILIVSIGLFIQIIKYQPLFPKIKEIDPATQNQFVIPLYPEDPIMGNTKAPITIIAFEDFSCAACSQQNSTLENLIERHPNKFKVIWKGLPVTEFPFPSLEAQKYAYCANEQKKFYEFKENAFANSLNLSENILQTITSEIELDEKKLSKCLNAPEVSNYINNTKQIAQILNIQAVPAFFIDNKQIKNPSSDYQWEDLLGLTE